MGASARALSSIVWGGYTPVGILWRFLGVFLFQGTWATQHDAVLYARGFFLFVGTRRRLGVSPIEAIDRCCLAGFLHEVFTCHLFVT